MKSIAIKILVNAVAISVAAFLLKGISLGAGHGITSGRLVTVLWVGVIFGLVNVVIKPVLEFFSLPFIILTLGLFSLIVNAAMLELTSWFAVQVVTAALRALPDVFTAQTAMAAGISHHVLRRKESRGPETRDQRCSVRELGLSSRADGPTAACRYGCPGRARDAPPSPKAA